MASFFATITCRRYKPWLKNKRFTLAAKMTKSGVVGISEFKFKIQNFDRVRFDRYRL